jgi:hypothetical protein
MELYKCSIENESVCLSFECHICGHHTTIKLNKDVWFNYSNNIPLELLNHQLNDDDFNIVKHRICDWCKRLKIIE